MKETPSPLSVRTVIDDIYYGWKMKMPGSHSYPRVLVIDATPFTRRRNNGILKSNLFQGWPKSHLAQIDYSNIQPGFDVCERYWRLKKTGILQGLLGKAPNAALSSAGQDLTVGNTSKESEYDDRPQIERRLSFLNPQVRELIGEGILRLPSVLSAPMRGWIDDFHPDIIYSNLGMGPIVRLVVNVAKWRNIPIMPHFFDDWVNTLYKDHFLAGLLRGSMFHWFHECLRLAPISLTISDSMKDEYAKRYGGRFETFMNCVEVSGAATSPPRPAAGGVVRLLFAGSLEPERWRSLRQIGAALRELHARGIHGELSIYTFPDHIEKYRSSLDLEPVMRIAGTATPAEVAELQRLSDILIHVESFDTHSRRYTKFSLSTKIPQYLMSGTCIFAYGPGEVASLRYLSENGTGLVVGDDAPDHLRSALARLITDGTLRQALAQKARATAIERHDAKRQRAHFHELMVEACELWPYDKQAEPLFSKGRTELSGCL